MSKAGYNHSILIVDDESDILEFLSYNLKKEGYRVYTANNAPDGIELAKDVHPVLIILDIMMPQMDGIEACQILRKELSHEKPVITFLTSRGEDYSQIAGYEVGADDYITKPIRPRLLIKKVESLLRRSMEEKNVDQEYVRIDREKYVVETNGEKLVLPKKEFELLELLVSKPGKVFTRDQILSIVWGNHTIVGARTIDVHIRKLREKLGNDYIRTIKGVGYTFNEL